MTSTNVLLFKSHRKARISWGVVSAAIMFCLAMVSTGGIGLTSASPGQNSPSGPEFIPGDYVSLTCQHSNISLNGTLYCNHASGVQWNLGGGYHSYTMVATTDAGYATMGWTTSGEACLGVSPSCGNSSGPSTVPFWENCGTGLRCTGTVILHTYLMGPQTITARIFNAAGTITLNGTVLTNGQNLTLGHVQVVPISGNVSNSSYIFLKWLTDDGSLANANSSSTNLTVDSNPSSQGNLTMVVKLISGNYSYAGLIATGSAISKAAATFVVPIVSYSCHIDCIYAQVLPLWVGIGGDSLLAGRGNLWQAGVTVYVNQTGGTKTEYAEAWYESFYSNGTHNFVPVTQVGLGTTVTVTVTYNALTGLSGYSIVCDNHPAAGCGYLPKNGSVLFTPTTTNAEWVTELGIGGFPELFTGSNLSFASPCLTASGVSSSSFVVPAGAYWAQGEPEWHLISVGTITPTWFGLEED